MNTVIWKNNTFTWAYVHEDGEVTFQAKNFRSGAKGPIIVMEGRSARSFTSSGTVFRDGYDVWKLVLDDAKELHLELHIGALNEKN